MFTTDPTPHRDGELAVRSDAGRKVCLVSAMGLASDTKRYADLIATALNVGDARLIAAAPELLEALQRLEAHGHTEATWQFALKAISKATS